MVGGEGEGGVCVWGGGGGGWEERYLKITVWTHTCGLTFDG